MSEGKAKGRVFAVAVVVFEYGKATGTKGYRLFGRADWAEGWRDRENGRIGKGAQRYEHAGPIREIEANETALELARAPEGAWILDLWRARA